MSVSRRKPAPALPFSMPQRARHRRPSISIGMPVRNGAAHVAQAIESFLKQTFPDFELTAYDNASSDDTVAIVSAIAANDSRVRVARHAQNIGAAANFIYAAEHALGEFFCWAAHDDLREPEFLATLLRMLQEHPQTSLACCAVRNIDPDGTLRNVRPETALLRTTQGMTTTQRLRMYLRETPGTPFYGLFRTAALRQSLHTLRELNELGKDGPAILGIDMIFLARFVRDHDLTYSPEALILFRRGGVSHDLGRYGSLRKYFQQLWSYQLAMKAATVCSAGVLDRLRLRVARWRSLARLLLSREMRSMHMHYVRESMPLLLHAPRAWLACRLQRPLRRLRRRVSDLPRGSRIVLFGAGKHTRRRLRELRMAIDSRVTLIAACDDRADICAPLDELPIVKPASLLELAPVVLLVSSDTYEQAMFHRALAIAPGGTSVWALYDDTLEARHAAEADCRSIASTPATKSANSIHVSPVIAGR